MVKAAELAESIRRHIRYSLGIEEQALTRFDLYKAVALAVRDLAVDGMLATERRVREADSKRVYYLSMEYLMGRALGNNLINLGAMEAVQEALRPYGFDLDELRDEEVDAALGNGGLGRLAACYLDSMATLDIPGYGYGINYEYGLFRQAIFGGCQKEQPDAWLQNGSPWLIERPSEVCIVPVYGRVDSGTTKSGEYNPMWLDWRVLFGVPQDMPVIGYGGRTVNFLRLYSARASNEFDMSIFNTGDYLKAVRQKMMSETISKVLYPSDTLMQGRELRLVQEYFFVACAIRDIVRRYLEQHEDFERFPDRVAIQLNDTHPALAVAELMRYLVDERDMPWTRAWDTTVQVMAFTNHTLLPEALEQWPAGLMERVLPRHTQIIFEINRRFLEQVELRWPGDAERRSRMSIVGEGEGQNVRMAHLAIVGSHSVNGVAELHTHLVKTKLVPDFHELWPKRFSNKTNGITQRRWLLKSNPGLADLIRRAIGDGWITDLDALRGLEASAGDAAFQEEFRAVKIGNKERLARVIHQTTRVEVDPQSLFDIQAKRIHEYKRQLLNAMHIIHQYLALVEDERPPSAPRTYVFAGKAAPGYWAAKQIIRLVNAIAAVVNGDPRVDGSIRVVFVPDYRVSLAERIIPAADLSEQISTAGMEASGTGNMKFALNGALTMGTLDGANIEILEEVGAENIYIFGLRAEQIAEMRRDRSYRPRAVLENPDVARVVEALASDRFSPKEPGLFSWIRDALVDQGDRYFHLADLPAYIEAQDRAGNDFHDHAEWSRRAILNVARVGKFSSDRSIREYATDIWKVHPVRHGSGVTP